MKSNFSHITVLLLLARLTPLHSADAQPPHPTPWVIPGDSGKLSYQRTGNGDRIVDFSHAGYRGGGVRLTTCPVRKEVAPSGGDDSSAIQEALDYIAELPLTDDIRGAVLLRPGTFHCSKPLTISQKGVVLRGSGSGNGGTVIEMTGTPHTAVKIIGGRMSFPKENPAGLFPITDDYVPSGVQSLSVGSVKGLEVGDAIRIRWPRTEKWIHFMGMDALVRDGKPQTWIKANSPTVFDRTIRSINGSRLTLDVPLTDAIDARLLAPDTAVVIKTTEPPRLAQCGLESLQIHSPPPAGDLAAPNNTAVELDHCEDCWVRDVTTHDALNIVRVLGGARRITIQSVHATHTASVAKGAGYPSDFTLVGSQVLIDRCTSSGDGAFYVATLNSGAVLNVALNCTFEGKGGIQPHMRWSTGLLLDGCHLPDGKIDFINRGTAGSGHGWAVGWAVAWNCTAKLFDVQQPPGAINWCIGCIGGLKQGAVEKSPWLSSHGTHVLPKSLYLAQLRERLGDSALESIGY